MYLKSDVIGSEQRKAGRAATVEKVFCQGKMCLLLCQAQKPKLYKIK